MGPEARARFTEYNKSAGAATATRRDPYVLPSRFANSGLDLERGLNGALAADLYGLLAAERSSSGGGYIPGYHTSRTYSDQRSPAYESQRGTVRGDVDYREKPPRTSGGRSPLPYSDLLNERILHRLPERRRSPGAAAAAAALLYEVGRSLRRSRSPLGPRRGRSPYLPRRSLSPYSSLTRGRSRLRRSPSPSHAPFSKMHPEKRALLRNCYCVKVMGLPPHTLYRSVWGLFKPHAAVAFVEMMRDEQAALVYFSDLEERERVLVAADSILEPGMSLAAWEGGGAAVPAEPLDEAHPKANRTLLVGNLDKAVSRKELRLFLQRFGRIVDVDIRRLPRASHYYALVQFFSVRSVCEAMAAVDGALLGSSRVRLSFGVTPPCRCICVQGLAPDLTSDYIMERFMRYGPVDKVTYDPLGRAALVLFKSIVPAEEAIRHILHTPSENLLIDYADDHYQMHFCRAMQAKGLDTGDFLFL